MELLEGKTTNDGFSDSLPGAGKLTAIRTASLSTLKELQLQWGCRVPERNAVLSWKCYVYLFVNRTNRWASRA